MQSLDPSSRIAQLEREIEENRRSAQKQHNLSMTNLNNNAFYEISELLKIISKQNEIIILQNEVLRKQLATTA